jgi:membrane fusion protein (multidrug efflux system)
MAAPNDDRAQGATPAAAEAEKQPERNGARRKKLMAAVLGVALLLGGGYGIYWALVGRYVESTDDAYVAGNIVQITPQVAGTVVSIGAEDTEFVDQGHVLVQLDDSDAKVALQQAESQLAKAVRSVRNLFAATSQQQANVAVHETDLERAHQDLARRERLAASGAISREEVQHARDAERSAQAALDAARQQLLATRVLVEGTTVEQHPEVQHAAAQVKDAYLDYARTALPAPVSGFVAKRNVQLGQRVSPGAPLMAVVPLTDVWVDANFKEPQLAHVRIGQPATLTADVYGGKVEYHGKVVGLGAGTGSAFALLPAQNASGNWIKIVQRVPVRVALDANELASHPLQVGLSMQVEVDTHDRSGQRLPRTAHAGPSYRTEVFDTSNAAADARVKEIIAANAGGRLHAARAMPPLAAPRKALEARIASSAAKP